MKLSILIPSRNMAGRIGQFFEYVYNGLADENEFEVIVVDSSTDSSMDEFRKYESHANLTVRHFDRQVMCGTARNVAYEMSKGEYVYCMDIDDRFYSQDSLRRVLGALDGKDIYYCPFGTKRDTACLMRPVRDIAGMADSPMGVWSKMYRREHYVRFPDYMPEDVAAHYLLIDKCTTVGSFGFPVYFYDNTNPSAISRTFEYMRAVPHNLMQLAFTSEIEDMKLRQEYVTGTLHNLADMFDLRDKLKNPVVRNSWMAKFRSEYTAVMAGIFVH